MPEGRVRNTGSSLKAEYIITDHQGNARVSFEDSGTGTAKVVQENSYYAYGMSMTSTMSLPTAPNKNLYNGGSEWQNDYQDQPDWQQTFYRNYDQTIGRFLAVDPMAEATGDMSVYQYGNNNPVAFNDPLGNLSKADIESFGPLKYKDGLSGGFWNKTYGSEQDWSGAIQYFWDNNLGIYNHRDNSAFWNAVANAANKFLDKYNSSNEEQSLSFNLGNVDNTHGYDLTWTNLETTTVNDKYVVSVLGGHTFVQGANQGGDCCKTHAEELAKYGQIISSLNMSAGASVGAVGGMVERGIVYTDKNWARKYVTIYYSPGFVSPATSLGISIISGRDGHKPTFSDWQGAMVGFSGSFGEVGVNFGWTSTYVVGGLGWSPEPLSISIPGLKNGGSMNIGVTHWDGPAYHMDADFSRQYINQQTYLGGQ